MLQQLNHLFGTIFGGAALILMSGIGIYLIGTIAKVGVEAVLNREYKAAIFLAFVFVFFASLAGFVITTVLLTGR